MALNKKRLDHDVCELSFAYHPFHHFIDAGAYGCVVLEAVS
jgi:hypothetical protein